MKTSRLVCDCCGGSNVTLRIGIDADSNLHAATTLMDIIRSVREVDPYCYDCECLVDMVETEQPEGKGKIVNTLL